MMEKSEKITIFLKSTKDIKNVSSNYILARFSKTITQTNIIYLSVKKRLDCIFFLSLVTLHTISIKI